MWLTGIDEAGYGPVLGPLVMSAVTFEVPQQSPSLDLWHLLGSAVCAPGTPANGRLMVGDSKKLFSQTRGLRALEIACLSFARLLDEHCWRRLDLFLDLLQGKPETIRRDGPWFESLDLPLPTTVPPKVLDNQTTSLRWALAQTGIHLHSIRTSIVLPLQFNQLIQRTGNKATLLFDLCAAHLRQTVALPGTHTVVVDKHGGRNHYAHHLLSCGLPAASMNESAERSTYRIASDCQALRTVHFVARADQSHFTVALASMFSKYVRELLMRLFNRFWAQLVPGLKPTAGYPADAARFVQDIEPALHRVGINVAHIWRCR